MSMEIKGNFKIVKTDTYFTAFDMVNGTEIMSGINGHKDPEKLDMASLIDIGIMGSCSNNCDFCYQGDMQKPNMSLTMFKEIIDRCKAYTNQVALGGRGDPNLHKDFYSIMKYARDSYVVPNYTTSGKNLTMDQVEITKKYAGSVAVSDYSDRMPEVTFRALNMFINASVRTNIHMVVNRSNYAKILTILNGENPYGSNFDITKLNAIVLLLLKPQGKAKLIDKQEFLNKDEIQVIIKAIRNSKAKCAIGVDSCLFNHFKDLNESEQIFGDNCSASRSSAYINAQRLMRPCSFADEERWSINIKHHSLKDIWNSALFHECFCRIHNNPNKCPFGL